MRAAIICIDTRGGIQPYLGLGLGLRTAGHDVLVVAPKNYRSFIESVGLTCAGMEGDIQSFMQDPHNAAILEKGFLASHKLMLDTTKQFIRNWTKECLSACEGWDLILGGFGGMFIGEGVAEKLQIPFIQAHLQPLSTTTAFPGVIRFGWLPRLMGGVNQLSHFVSRQIFWQPLRGAINLARQEVLGLPPTHFWGNVGKVRRKKDLILYGYSPHLLPRPNDWKENIHVTGYWFLDQEESWSPPEGLVQFLERGPAPISIGFGSMSIRDREATTRLVLDAVKETGQRVVLISGWGGMKSANLPEWAYAIDSIPHSWLLPRTCLAIHHGGAGTTGAALRAGIPSIIVPFGADQPYWAWLISQKGYGTNAGPRKRLTAKKLAQAITNTLVNPSLRDRTAEVGRIVRSEDGVAKAVALLEANVNR